MLKRLKKSVLAVSEVFTAFDRNMEQAARTAKVAEECIRLKEVERPPIQFNVHRRRTDSGVQR